MAVTTTPEDVYLQAYATSKKNQPGAIAAEATELVDVVHRATQTAFALAARINPTFFGATSAVVYGAPGWARPGDAESIWRIENAGVEVKVVPFDDRSAEGATRDALYYYGGIYRPAVTNPASGTLDFFYSKKPTRPADQVSTLDALWEFAEDHNDFLVFEVALYLAIKDNRENEVAWLREQRDAALRRFVFLLEHSHIGLTRRFNHYPVINTETRIPITSLLAGGTNVEL